MDGPLIKNLICEQMRTLNVNGRYLFSGNICSNLGLANIGDTGHDRSGGIYWRFIRGPLWSYVSRQTDTTGCKSGCEERALPKTESVGRSVHRSRNATKKTLRAEKISHGILPGIINIWRPLWKEGLGVKNCGEGAYIIQLRWWKMGRGFQHGNTLPDVI